MADKRQQKAQLLFNGGVRPTETRKDTWTVPASSGPLVYEVQKDGTFLSCSCPDFAVRGGECKHVLFVQLSLDETETKERKCDKCLEARHGGPAEFSGGCHVWCSHEHTLVEPETKQGCEWFLDRSRLIIV